MSPDLPLVIEPAKLAVSGEHLTGQLQLQQLDHISDLILNRDGWVNYLLAFGKDEKGVVTITGEISASLTVRCQRCLNEMQLQLQGPVNIAVIDNHLQMDIVPDSLEPVIAEEHKIALPRLIADELLLAMPLAPVHERTVCPAADLVGGHAVKKDNPFAVLKSLKKSKP
jgi:uncharacterized protein